MTKQTGDRVSALAGKYGRIEGPYITAVVERGQADQLAADIRSMAASLRSQDEVKGLRGLWNRVRGK